MFLTKSTSPARASAAPGTPPSPFAEGGGDVPASIQRAAEDGQVGAVLSWFDGGGRVDVTFEYIFLDGPASGMTLLMVAMTNGHAELAEALLRRGADVSLQASNGGTALSLAATTTAARKWSRAGFAARRGDQSEVQRRQHCADDRRLRWPRADCRHADPARRRDSTCRPTTATPR